MGIPQYADFMESKFNERAGNLNTLAGTGSEAKTFGQEKILNQNSSKQVVDMAMEVNTTVKGIISAIAYYIWNDPIASIPIKKRVEGVPGLEITSEFNAQDKGGDFNDYGIQIYPYSLQERTPEQLVQATVEILAQVYLPMIEEAKKQGISVDIATLMSEIGDQTNNPMLARVLLAESGLLTERDQGSSSEPRQAAHTTRENIRTNNTPEQNSSPLDGVSFDSGDTSNAEG